jgi:hypothetical protein
MYVVATISASTSTFACGVAGVAKRVSESSSKAHVLALCVLEPAHRQRPSQQPVEVGPALHLCDVRTNREQRRALVDQRAQLRQAGGRSRARAPDVATAAQFRYVHMLAGRGQPRSPGPAADLRCGERLHSPRLYSFADCDSAHAEAAC